MPTDHVQTHSVRPALRGWRSLSFGLILAVSLSLALFALFGWTLPVRAGSFVVTKTADTADGVCDADCSLREAIIAANANPGPDTITLGPGVYLLTRVGNNDENGNLNIHLDIGSDLTLIGAGSDQTIIDGAGIAGGEYPESVMEIYGPWDGVVSVRISGVTIRNGNRSGISVTWADVILEDSIVVSNTTDLQGGGINFFGRGDTGALTIRRSTISDNTAVGSGGGIYMLGKWLILENSIVVSNTADGEGGGILADVRGGGYAKVISTTASYNIADYASGGMLFRLDDPNAKLTITNSTIEHNVAGDYSGGGLSFFGAGLVDITDSTFAYNRAPSGAGLNFYIDPGSAVTLTRSTIAENLAVQEDSPPSGAGIQYFETGLAGLTRLTLLDSTIRDNVAHRPTVTEIGCGAPAGAGIDITGATVFITRTTFSNNRLLLDEPACGRSSGGGAKISFGEVTIIDSSIFVSNTAEYGGGLVIASAHATIRNTSFLSNTAASGGGGLANEGDLTATDVVIRGNTAGDEGGGGAIGNMDLIRGLVEGNTTSGNGGGIYGGGRLLSSIVSGNSAANGGGISVWGGDVTVISSTINANTATGDGGGIFVSHAYRGGPIVNVTNSTLSGNSAARGGAFSDASGLSSSGRFTNKANFLNVTLADNTASGLGGGIYHAGYIGYDQENDIEDPQNLTLENTLLSNRRGNCANAVADDPTFISLGHNLSSDSKCLRLTGPGDLNSTPAQIGPLQDNGGPTKTNALLAGSPAIDSGDAANCPVIDQRGIARPQGGGCDIGAFEWQPTAPFLHLSSLNLAFTAVSCAVPPANQPITVTNTGAAGVFNWTATKNQSWLNVTPGSGTVPSQPQISVNQSGLSSGAYTGTVTFAAASGVGGSPKTVSVALSVVKDSDLVRSSGFEAGPNGDWIESSTNFPHVIRPASELGAHIAPHTGNWAALMGVVNGEVSELTQSVLVPPGVTALLKYWYYVSSPEVDCDFDTVVVQVNGTTVREHPLCQSNNTTGWAEASVPLTAYGGQWVTLRFRGVNDASTDPSVFMLDDVRLAIDPPCTVVTPTPTPTATPTPAGQPTATPTSTPTATPTTIGTPLPFSIYLPMAVK